MVRDFWLVWCFCLVRLVRLVRNKRLDRGKR